MFLRKKKAPQNYLSFVPLRKVTEFTETDGKITLLVAKFKSEGLRKWLVPKHKSPHFKIHLDETGSDVWRLIDDKSNVEEICARLTSNLEAQGKPVIQIEERVTKYLTDLYKARFIEFKNL